MADYIIWDEAPMNHKHVAECVDRTFRDMVAHIDPTSPHYKPNAHKLPFGGKIVIFENKSKHQP